MDEHDPTSLANVVADRITDRTGRVWDDDARLRLTRWLADPACRYVADEWLRLIESPADSDQSDRVFIFGTMMSGVLAGTAFPSVRLNGFTSRTRWWLPWRRRDFATAECGRPIWHG